MLVMCLFVSACDSCNINRQNNLLYTGGHIQGKHYKGT